MTATVPTPPRPDPTQDPTPQQQADQAFNQLNPTYELAIDRSIPGWHQAVQRWEAYRSLGGRVDNHLRIDNAGPAWGRRMVVIWRAHEALQRGARKQAEETFTRLNPDFGVLPDSMDPAQHGFAQQRERGLALGVRAAVDALDEAHADPQQRQTAITARARTAARQGRGDQLRQARHDRSQSLAAERRAEGLQRRSGDHRPRAEREEERGR